MVLSQILVGTVAKNRSAVTFAVHLYNIWMLRTTVNRRVMLIRKLHTAFEFLHVFCCMKQSQFIYSLVLSTVYKREYRALFWWSLEALYSDGCRAYGWRTNGFCRRRGQLCLANGFHILVSPAKGESKYSWHFSWDVSGDDVLERQV